MKSKWHGFRCQSCPLQLEHVFTVCSISHLSATVLCSRVSFPYTCCSDRDCLVEVGGKRDRGAATLFMNPFRLLMKDNLIRNVFKIKLRLEEQPCSINTQTSVVRPVIVVLGVGQSFEGSTWVTGPSQTVLSEQKHLCRDSQYFVGGRKSRVGMPVHFILMF